MKRKLCKNKSSTSVRCKSSFSRHCCNKQCCLLETLYFTRERVQNAVSHYWAFETSKRFASIWSMMSYTSNTFPSGGPWWPGPWRASTLVCCTCRKIVCDRQWNPETAYIVLPQGPQTMARQLEICFVFGRKFKPRAAHQKLANLLALTLESVGVWHK